MGSSPIRTFCMTTTALIWPVFVQGSVVIRDETRRYLTRRYLTRRYLTRRYLTRPDNRCHPGRSLLPFIPTQGLCRVGILRVSQMHLNESRRALISAGGGDIALFTTQRASQKETPRRIYTSKPSYQTTQPNEEEYPHLSSSSILPCPQIPLLHKRASGLVPLSK